MSKKIGKAVMALKTAFRTLLGFLVGIAIKPVLTVIIAYHFVINVL